VAKSLEKPIDQDTHAEHTSRVAKVRVPDTFEYHFSSVKPLDKGGGSQPNEHA
jgi:hypothetical protein